MPEPDGRRRFLHHSGRGRRPLVAGALVLGTCLALSAAGGQALAGAKPMLVAQQDSAPRITAPATITAPAATQTPLAIRIAPPDAIPARSFLRLRGLPPTVSLSVGHAIGPGAWAVPLTGLPGLVMNVPVGLTGRSALAVSLVGEDGTLLAEAAITLVIQPPPPPPAPPPVEAARPEPKRAEPARPKAPILSPADREAAEKFLSRGESEIDQGNVAVARQFFLRAAQMGLARAALMLAATYDSTELTRWRVQGVQPNVGEARKWYERARELGAPEAEERLARLGGG